jgi:endonuclease/exonuclease/phosphatase family metal-dependent hydrolase
LRKQWKVVLNDPPAPSAPATTPRSRIDYIFYRPSNAFRLIKTNVVNEPIASDHRPVFAELVLQKPQL